jgi:hypothetical protein
LYSDFKIGLIRKYIDSIWFSCFGVKGASARERFYEPTEPYILESLEEDTIRQNERSLVPSNELFFFLSASNLQALCETMPDPIKKTSDDKEAILVAVHWIGVFMTSCLYPQSKRLALEMLLKIGQASSMEVRLQFVLPYVLQMFDDESSKVKAKAVHVAVEMFKDIMDQAHLTVLSATDYKVFDNYILPAFVRLKNECAKDSYVHHVFVSCLPLLAQIGHRFLEMSVGSRFQRNFKHKAPIPVMEDSTQHEEEDDDNLSQHLFSQSEFLLTNPHHMSRQTIVTQDRQVEVKAEKPHKHYDHQEVFSKSFDLKL